MITRESGREANQNAMSELNLQDIKQGRRLLKSKELALYIGSTEAGVYQMVSRRQVPFVKLGRSTRFDIRAIDKWIEQKSVRPLNIQLVGGRLGHYQETQR